MIADTSVVSSVRLGAPEIERLRDWELRVVDFAHASRRDLSDALLEPIRVEFVDLGDFQVRRALPSAQPVVPPSIAPDAPLAAAAHHLLNDGHAVVGIDGLKIEPLDPALSGITVAGERVQLLDVV